MSETIVPPTPTTSPVTKIKLPAKQAKEAIAPAPPQPKPESNSTLLFSIKVTLQDFGPQLDAVRNLPGRPVEYFRYKGTNKNAKPEELMAYLSKMLVGAKWQPQPYA